MGAIRGIVKREYTDIEAVKGVTLEIAPGERVGFLGPNGAGKTTTLKMLSGIIHPTSGEIEVLGHVPAKRDHDMLRRISLVMGNKSQLWWDLPAWDSFNVLKELYEVSDADFERRTSFLIESLQLEEKVRTQVRKLSLGERMKCELVGALLHAPEVVFLDEPTLGLDVVSQKRIREFLLELHREQGNTMLLTSHYMQDVEELCDRVIVIDHGTVVFEGTLRDLSAKFTDVRSIRFVLKQPVEEADLARFGKVRQIEDLEAVIDVPSRDVPSVLSAALQALPVEDVSTQEVDIEDVIRDLFTRT
jgi:ABC-2 type transport system ATP-binding protein